MNNDARIAARCRYDFHEPGLTTTEEKIKKLPPNLDLSQPQKRRPMAPLVR